MARDVWGFAGFAALGVVVVGLVGVAGTYMVPIPYERLMAREATLDEAALALTGPAPRAAIQALGPRLDDSAALITPPDDAGAAAMLPRVMEARDAARAALGQEARTIAYRLRAMTLVTTLAGVVFVGAMLRAAAGPAG